MKILFLTLDMGRTAGGLFYSVKGLAKEFNNHDDVEVEVVGLINKVNIGDIQTWDGVNIKVFPVERLFGKFVCSLRLLQYLLRKEVDVIYLHGIWNFASLALLIRIARRKVKFVVCPRGMLDSWIVNNNRILKRLYWSIFEGQLLSRAEFIHALNHREAKEILKILPSSKIVISPNAIDKVADTTPDYTSNLKRLVYLGRLDEKKGVVQLIDAWLKIAPKDWELFIYGWGEVDYVDKVKRLVGAASSPIAYEGPVFGNEKALALSRAHAFVLPSFSEGLPMAVLEAWSYGLPTIITDECNLPESFDAGVSFRLSHSEGIELGLRKFLNATLFELRTKSVESKAFVEANYTWRKVVESLLPKFIEISDDE